MIVTGACVLGWSLWNDNAPAVTEPATEPALPHSAATTPDSQNSATQPEVELAEEKQRAVWDAEHITFEIENRFGNAFRAAVVERDADRLRSFFREDAVITLAAASDLTSVTHAGVTRWQPRNDRLGTPGTRQAAVDWLMRTTRDFAKFTRSRLRVLSIHQLPEDPSQWQTTLLLSLTGEQSNGDRIQVSTQQHVAFRIDDETTLAEASTILDWRYKAFVLRTGAQPLFDEQTDHVQLDQVDLPDNWELPTNRVAQYRFQVAVADFNQDDLLDIAISSRGVWLLLSRDSIDGPFRNVAPDTAFLELLSSMVMPETIGRRSSKTTCDHHHDPDQNTFA